MNCDNDEETNKAAETAISAKIQGEFLKQRKIFLWGAVNDASAKEITEKFLYLESVSPGAPITFYINTPGGAITAGMAIFDTIRLISSPVKVIVTGIAASMGSILLSAAAKGNRFLYPHAQVMIHQPLIVGQFQGPAVDIHIQAQEMERTRRELNRILSEASGQSLEKVTQDTDRDFYLSAEEAISYGLADAIVVPDGATPNSTQT